ncbi:OprO/OprP family phosphate-selective porin [Desulforhabdus amnigena]|uniref:Porin n=1 Tax=Desulforhabdus amnigena TaxID=40218 RepID=A0A9W6D2V7_9BACT|nr:porin [Desulforhabdus amnigena]NLJ29815.1 porin [Deltaproteobacteria bacterium]GLI33909.1 porin [Desulforhabdus amnigena]
MMESSEGLPQRWRAPRFAVSFIMFTLWILWAGLALADEKSVAEKIIEILRANGQISEEQYKELVKEAGKEESKPNDFRVYWKEGIRFESEDRKTEIKAGGVIQTDWAAFDPDEEVDAAFSDDDIDGHGVEFRRARLFVEGTIYENYEFKSEFEFAEGDVDFTDVWLGMKNIPYVGRIRVGHQKEPFSLEELTSSKFITFMERGLPNAFSPGRNTGLTLSNQELNGLMTWAMGAFYETDDFGDSFADFSDYQATARITGLPWYCEDGRELVHLGLSYSHKFRDSDETTVRFSARPEAHLTDARLADTGSIATDGVDLFNPEFAMVYGPFSLQGEYFQALVDSEADDYTDFYGFYVFASYFLTGEHRPYKTSSGAFDRVKPRQNFNPVKGGWGAWELGVRYSRLDLNDAGITGGREQNYTFGLNWYPNPNMRVMFNYVLAQIEDREDLGIDDADVNIFESRFQVDF